MSKWQEIERNCQKEFEKEFPEDAKRIEESFKRDFAEMDKYGKDFEKLTKEFAKKFTTYHNIGGN